MREQSNLSAGWRAGAPTRVDIGVELCGQTPPRHGPLCQSGKKSRHAHLTPRPSALRSQPRKATARPLAAVYVRTWRAPRTEILLLKVTRRRRLGRA